MVTPADDFVVEGELSVQGAPGGIAFRATNGRESVRGAMLIVTPGGPRRAPHDRRYGRRVADRCPHRPRSVDAVHVKITVKGTKVDAIVGTSMLSATLPANLAKGEVGLVRSEVRTSTSRGFTLKKK